MHDLIKNLLPVSALGGGRSPWAKHFMKKPENIRMEAFLLHHGIKATAKWRAKGSYKFHWHLYNGIEKWTPELTAKLNALGFTDYYREPLGLYHGNGGTFSVHVRGHSEFLQSDPVLTGDLAPLISAPGGILYELRLNSNNDDDLARSTIAIAQARELWRLRCAEYFTARGDVGTCVSGAGIAIKYLAPRCKNPVRRIIIGSHTVTNAQGSCVWEASVKEILAMLHPYLCSAYYACGHMD